MQSNAVGIFNRTKKGASSKPRSYDRSYQCTCSKVLPT